MTSNPFRRRVLAALVPALVLAIACGGERASRVEPPVPVRAAPAVRKTMPVAFRAVGHVEPIATVEVRSRIGGELTRVWFTEGQTVRSGDTLFTIDPRPYEAALRQAEAQLARDEPLLRKAEEDVRRYVELVEKDFVTREQYDMAVASAESLRASVAADLAYVDHVRLELSYCTIRSPVTARTGGLVIKAGSLVKANDQVLVTLNQIRPIYVAFSVPALWLPEVRRRDGRRIVVTATLPDAPGSPSEGSLTFFDNEVDSKTGTILMRATFPNEDEMLWPGQFANVLVTLDEEPDRIVVPASAVLTGQEGTYVFLVRDDLTVEMRAVRLHRIDGEEAVISEGLSGSETVVTDGHLRLVPGARVAIRSAPKAEAPRS